MNALLQSRSIEDFIPLLRGIPELGDPFYLSMLHWCGIGVRPYPLKFWEVFLLTENSKKMGVTGLYQREETADSDVWVGWFGIIQGARSSRLGTRLLELTMEEAVNRGFHRLLVYCDRDELAVPRFYLQNQFLSLGQATDVFPGQTSKPHDVVFAKILKNG